MSRGGRGGRCGHNGDSLSLAHATLRVSAIVCPPHINLQRPAILCAAKPIAPPRGREVNRRVLARFVTRKMTRLSATLTVAYSVYSIQL